MVWRALLSLNEGRRLFTFTLDYNRRDKTMLGAQLLSSHIRVVMCFKKKSRGAVRCPLRLFPILDQILVAERWLVNDAKNDGSWTSHDRSAANGSSSCPLINPLFSGVFGIIPATGHKSL